jgi:hypothetical protein
MSSGKRVRDIHLERPTSIRLVQFKIDRGNSGMHLHSRMYKYCNWDKFPIDSGSDSRALHLFKFKTRNVKDNAPIDSGSAVRSLFPVVPSDPPMINVCRLTYMYSHIHCIQVKAYTHEIMTRNHQLFNSLTEAKGVVVTVHYNLNKPILTLSSLQWYPGES